MIERVSGSGERNSLLVVDPVRQDVVERTDRVYKARMIGGCVMGIVGLSLASLVFSVLHSQPQLDVGGKLLVAIIGCLPTACGASGFVIASDACRDWQSTDRDIEMVPMGSLAAAELGIVNN